MRRWRRHERRTGLPAEHAGQRDLEQNSHLGVENVRSRLEILFGEESTVIFESVVEKGTCVKLCVRQNMNI